MIADLPVVTPMNVNLRVPASREACANSWSTGALVTESARPKTGSMAQTSFARISAKSRDALALI